MTAVPRITIDPTEIARFEEALGNVVRRFGVDVTLLVKKVAFDLVRDIMRSTPVDTGRARAAWSVWLDRVSGRPRGPRGYQSLPRAKNASSDTGTPEGIALGTAEGSFEERLTAPAPGLKSRGRDVVFVEVANNVKHILPLEFGWSKQARQGMVRVQVRRHARHYIAQFGGPA